MKKIRLFIVSLFLALALVVPAGYVAAANPFGDVCNDPDTSDSVVCENKEDSANDIVKVVINTLLFIVGILSVIMIIVGGLRYTTSAGNQNAVTTAKNTILYAIVGLVVSLLAFIVVNWVMDQF